MIRFLAPYVIVSLALAVLIGGAGLYGYRLAVDHRNAQDARDYIQGRKDTDNATDNLPADDPGIIEWLLDF